MAAAAGLAWDRWVVMGLEDNGVVGQGWAWVWVAEEAADSAVADTIAEEATAEATAEEDIVAQAMVEEDMAEEAMEGDGRAILIKNTGIPPPPSRSISEFD
ncbi:hypothetical protein FE257_007414 [Aspergillus nanangensis]|uniref:Uncharacterized protein n=1 Tax=Aspergillus nanangensis TaxID=2582783 RepID=A0AAD4CMM3_ASPNN|nr:hypothetical protein FE257_007414 [Aspergillus nanangensis]